MAKIAEQVIVYDGSKTADKCSATFQDVCVLPSGRILVSWRGGPQKGPINMGENGYYCISDDGGKTWTEPKAPFGTLKIDGGEGRARGFQLLALGGDKVFGVMSLVEEIGESLPYFNEETEAIKNTQLYTFFSSDGGETFSTPQRIEMKSKYKGLSCVLTSPPLLLKDGRIMVNFEVYKTYYDEGPFSHHAACVFSSDGGKTWGEEVTIREAGDIYPWDHRAGELEQGHIVDYIWTFDRRINDYLNIHMTESFDGGYTWSDLMDVGLPGQAGNPVQLPDGRVALPYFDRTGVPTLKLAFSSDGGKTFGEPMVVYRHEAPKAEHAKNAYAEAWAEMGKYTAGHCFQDLTTDGNLLIVNYAGPETHKTNTMLTRVLV